MARYLGFELTESLLKAVVVRAAYKKLTVEAVYRYQREPGPEGLALAAQTVLQAVGPVDAVYAALPGNEAALRRIELPKAVYKRGPKVLSNELDGALPFEVDDAVLDGVPLAQGAVVELLVAAARTERARSVVEALRVAGGEPRELGVAPLAFAELASHLPAFAGDDPVLVVHGYDTTADVAIVRRGAIELARTLGAQSTPQARARALKQTLGAHLTAGGAAPIAAFLLGEAAYYYPEVVAEAALLPADAVFVGLPAAQGLELAPSVNPAEVPLAPVALAMALRGLGKRPRVDLRRGPLAVTGGAEVLRERAGLFAGLAMALVVSLGFAQYARYEAAAEERDRLKVALANVTQEVFGERVSDPRRATSLAHGQGGDTEPDPLPGADAYDVIGVLARRIPTGLRHDLTQLDVRDERIEIQGLVDSLADRDRIVEALGQYECFRSVTPGRAQRNPGDSRQQYAVDIELRCPTERERAQGQQAAARRPAGASAAPSARAGASARPVTGATATPAATGGR